MSSSLYDQLGGPAKLRQIVDHFVERVHSDLLIGFLFAKVDLAQLKQHEFEYACKLLGGPVSYTGRPLRAVHQPLKIGRGQFARRQQLLAEVLRAQAVPQHVGVAWLQHQAQLEAVIVDQSGQSGCPS